MNWPVAIYSFCAIMLVPAWALVRRWPIDRPRLAFTVDWAVTATLMAGFFGLIFA